MSRFSLTSFVEKDTPFRQDIVALLIERRDGLMEG